MQQFAEEPIENNVQHICQLARAGKEEELAEFLKTHCVGEYVAGENAVYILAREQDEQAVDLLIKKFSANRNDAVIGYAEAGNVRLMNKQLARGAMYQYALCGAVLGKHNKIINDLLSRGPFSTIFAIAYAARKPEFSQIYDKLTEAQKKYADDEFFEADAIRSAAIFGNFGLVDQILNRAQASDNDAYYSNVLQHAIVGAAQGNQEQLLKRLLSLPVVQTIPNDEKFGFILRGLACRGETSQLAQLLKEGGGIHHFVSGAAEAGKYDVLLHLTTKEILREISSDRYLILLDTAMDSAGAKGHQDLFERIYALKNFVGSTIKSENPDMTQDDIEEILNEGLRLKNTFLMGAVEGGQIHILNMKVFEEADFNLPNEFLASNDWYLSDSPLDHPKPEEILRIASFLNVEARNAYIKSVVKKNFALTPKDNERLMSQLTKNAAKKKQLISDLIKKAAVLNNLMHKYDLNYNQALAWNIPQLHTWVSQTKGPINTLPRDLVLYIGSFVTSLTEEDALDLVVKMRADYETKLAVKKQAFFLSGESVPTVEKKPDDDTSPSPSKKTP